MTHLTSLCPDRHTGLDHLHAMHCGDVPGPPVATLIGFTLHAIAPGEVSFILHLRPDHLSPLGSVHGGIISTLLDSALACAAYTLLPAGAPYTSLNLHVHFVRALPPGPPVIATARVVHPGCQVITVEARLTEEDGGLYAHATSTILVPHRRTAS